MKKWLDNHLEKNKLDVAGFFRTAHYWNFQVSITSAHDVHNYRESGVIPIYVGRYVRFLQQLEGQRGQS